MDDKYSAINSSALSFAMPDMAMRMNKLPDGTMTAAYVFYRAPKAIEFRENGVEFNVFAPDAKTVEVSGTEMTRWGEERHPLADVGDGWWRTTVKLPAGVQFTYYFIDGVKTLYKYAPVCYAHSFVCNFVEVPDPDVDFYDFNDVPHGAVRCEYYASSYTGTLRNCWVYTPPGYEENLDKRYPVLYMLHGGGENETGWFWQGKINFIADNLIAKGYCKEMIIVTNSGIACGKDVNESPLLPGRVDELLINDCIPFIEKRFRTISDKSFRALCGLSMGAYQTQQICSERPGIFDYFGIFSGLRSGNYDEFLKTDAPDKFNAQHKLLFYSAGMQEGGDKLFDEIAKMKQRGIRAEGFTCEGVHEWQTWRYAAHEFLPKLFI